MNEEVRKVKYQQLYRNLVVIKENLQTASASFDDVRTIVKESVAVDHKMIEEESFAQIDTMLNEVENHLIHIVLPKIRYKL